MTLWRAFRFLTVTIFPLHPATKILIWLGFAIAIQGFGVEPLTLFSIVAALLLAIRNTGALLMVRRARWLLLSLLIIYSFATPGDALLPVMGEFSPSLQGVHGGVMQAWRLLLLLLTLGMLLQSCTRNSLLAGLYVLMRPFSILGFNPDRIAVRLWLTLQYAEQQPKRNVQGWWSELGSALASAPDADTSITLTLPAFSWRDVFVLLLASSLLGWVLW